MHCYIYEVSNAPIEEESRCSNTDLPDWFHGTIADGAYDTDNEERELAIESLVSGFGKNCSYIDGELRFTGNLKEQYFKGSFAAFRAAIATLSLADYRAFSGQQNSIEFASAMSALKLAYEDKFDHYIYNKDADELIPLDAWIRDLELTEPVYFGGVIDYHW